MGPAPVRSAVAGAPLSGQRALVLERLQQRDQPVTIAELAAELGLHANTVRQHLDALAERGLAVRAQVPAQGRGRPAWCYTAAPDQLEPDPRVRDYAGLATALAAHIARTSPDPRADALAAGREWGRELAAASAGAGAAPPRAGRGAAAGRRQVVEVMASLGFDPDADARATTAALRRCPLLDAARRHPEVVCQVHLGIVRGAMDVLGGDPERTDLLAFAEPGACRLHLLSAADPDA
jgi:predicted ArsR family transcriptional regulator